MRAKKEFHYTCRVCGLEGSFWGFGGTRKYCPPCALKRDGRLPGSPGLLQPCAVPECATGGKRLVGDVCMMHYSRRKKTGSYGPPGHLKDSYGACVRLDCEERAGPSGACRRHYKAVNTTPAQWLARTLRKHGCTVSRYEEMLERQGGGCAVCGATSSDRSGRRLAVDHDHSCCPGTFSCGRCIRGLLCTRCNQTLGHFGDDPTLIEKLAQYLRLTPLPIDFT